MSDEKWAPVPDYEGLYEVSDRGRVRSLDRIVPDSLGRDRALKGRVLTPLKGSKGRHLKVALSDGGKVRQHYIHRLVLEAFVGPCPEGAEACHYDDDPANNALENLRWASSSENRQDSVRNGRHHMARRTHCPHGHPFDEENTKLVASRPGRRICRTCYNAYQRKRRAERRT